MVGEARINTMSKSIREAIAVRFEAGEFKGYGPETIQLHLGGDTPLLARIEKVTGFAEHASKPDAKVYGVWWTDPTTGKRWHYGRFAGSKTTGRKWARA